MRKIIISSTLLLIFTLLLSACQNTASQPTPIQEDTFKTLVAGTLTAVAAEATQTQVALPTNTPTTGPTSTSEPTLTPTKEVVKVTITRNTNCRGGASTYFPVEVTLSAGTEVVLLARNKKGDYYYVQNPNDTTKGCWIWSEYATVSGNLETLPVFTPQPTPVPTSTSTPLPVPVFTVSYVGLTACGTGWAANFNIVNTGDLVMQSIRIKNTLQGVATPFVHTSNYFTEWSGGAEYLKQSDLVKGEQAIVSTCNPGNFTDDPTGKNVDAEITVCTKDDLLGACTTQLLSFMPH